MKFQKMKIINNIRLSYYIYILLAFLSLIIISEIITIPKSVVLNSYSPSMTSLSFDIRPRNPQKLKLHIKYSYINQNKKILNNSQKIDQFIFSDQFSTIYIQLPFKEKGRLNSLSVGFENSNTYEIRNIKLGSIDITDDLTNNSVSSDSLKIKQLDRKQIEMSCYGDKQELSLTSDFINNQKLEYVNISQNSFTCKFYKFISNFKGFKSIYYLLLGFVIASIFISRAKCSFRYSFFVFSILISVMYFRALSNNTFFYTRFEFLYAVFYSQIPIILTLSILFYAIRSLDNNLIKVVPIIIYIFLSFIIASDLFSFTMFSKRIVLDDIITYGKDALNSIDILLSFIKKKTVLFVLIIILFVLPFTKIKAISRSFKIKEFCLSLFVIVITCFILLPKPSSILSESYFSNIYKTIVISYKTNEKYTSKYQYINYEPKVTKLEGLNKRKNVIVLMVESLSAIDSKLLSNTRDNLPNLDNIAKEGIYFCNYFTNGYHTVTGNFSFLTGYPFVNGANLLDPKFYQESVPSHFSKFGYDTKLFHSDINIGSIEKLWNLANFDEYYDGTDDFYENSERLIFGSVPDGDLLKNVFNKLINCPKDKPYFAYVMTSTSHGPFIVPKTHQQNYEEVFRYVDKEIWNFYQELKKCGFFDNGILVITGDHRSMTPYTNHEKNIYGEIGFAKVPLIIVGDDTFRDYQEINLSHISLGPMLEQINLPTYITNDLNHIPNLTNNSAIIVQKAYPTDEVLIKYKNQEYILELNSDKTGINNSSEEAMHLNKEILPEITWIRK